MKAAITALALLALLLPGCEDSCVQLSREVCDCEPTELDQQACRQRVDINTADSAPSTAQLECCEGLLDTCTCKKLENGDLAACGLARETDAAVGKACLIPDN